ncbi:hypothetical protein GX50_08135 [[Emmonsia] crescens]|uniref:Uncharacterized protein n=1 Tax=[Emmonsia] crescens TaxID=73230 RepID=A0A2B7Z6U1_9EURO|nr:hypothetical protein GX50_08135 [Emmonsia crescens]
MYSTTYSPNNVTPLPVTENNIRIWDPSIRKLQETLEGHSDHFSPDGQLLASGDDEGIIRLCDPPTRACPAVLRAHVDIVLDIQFSANGQLLASESRDMTTLHTSLEGHKAAVWYVRFSRDGLFVASSSYDKSVRLWESKIKPMRRSVERHPSAVLRIVLSSDGQLLASSSVNRRVSGDE